MSLSSLNNFRASLLYHLKQERGSCIFFFLVGLSVRGIPELLVPWYPIGHETIAWYAPSIMTFAGKSIIDVFVQFFRSGPLLYMLMWPIANIQGVHSFLILKVFGPLLYGVLVAAFFVFLKRGLRLDWKLAFTATLLLAFQVAALRESWDRFRTVLSLIFLFATLTAFRSEAKHKWVFVSILSVLSILSREYVGYVLLVTILAFTILEKKDRLRSLIALCPALGILPFATNANLLSFLSNFASDNPIAYSHLWIVQDAFAIFGVCYLGLLPFVLKGLNLQKDRLLGPMIAWLLVGSFSVLSPWFVVPGYQRWLMLLVFPFSLFAVRGFERLCLFEKRRARMLKVIILIFVLVGIGYSTSAFSYVAFIPNSYVPANLVQSSIGWNQIDDVIENLHWLDEHAAKNSSILVEERFYGWTAMYLERSKEDILIIAYGADAAPSSVLQIAFQKGSSTIYLIWFSEQILRNFEIIHSQSTVSIFRYM